LIRLPFSRVEEVEVEEVEVEEVEVEEVEVEKAETHIFKFVFQTRKLDGIKGSTTDNQRCLFRDIR